MKSLYKHFEWHRIGTNEHPIKTYARDAGTEVIGHQLANRYTEVISFQSGTKVISWPTGTKVISWPTGRQRSLAGQQVQRSYGYRGHRVVSIYAVQVLRYQYV